MGLEEETKQLIHKLKRGQWIVRLSDIYTEPFLIESSDFPVDKDVNDEEVEERLESILGQYLQGRRLQERAFAPEISEDAWSLLLDVNQHPFRQLSTRSKELKLSWRRLEQAKAELLEKELLRESEVVLGSYRPVKYLIPTPYAISLLQRLGYDTRFWSYITHSGGGFEHRLHVVFLRNLAIKAGYEVQVEKVLGGKRVDLLLIKNGRRIGVEVQLKGIRAGEKFEELEELDELVIVVRDLRSLEIARSEINSWKPKVKVYTLGQYAKMLYNEANLLEEKPVMRRKQASSSPWRKAGEKPGEEEVGQV
ncbi:MAG: hypothetical protein QXP56_04680 [Archaeoglobaceae archaeon]